MAQVKILNAQAVKSLLNMQQVMEAVKKAYSYKCSGRAALFPLVCHTFEEGWSELDIKSGSVDGAGIFGMKLVSAFARNDEKGLPRLTGTILIFDRDTGILKSIMDGGCITNMRTGAAGGVGCQVLARPESETVLLLGTGAQGPNLVAATLEAMENLHTVYVSNPHAPEKAVAFCEEMPTYLVSEFFSAYGEAAHGTEMKRRAAQLSFIPVPADGLETACKQADIILTATPSRQPLIKAEWVKPGTHLSCIGSDMEGKQEVDEKLLQRARLFCDDRAQVVAVGECEKAVKAGLLSENAITEIGDVLLSKAAGRQSAEEITVFDSTGIALQDLMTASIITDSAEKKGMGVMVEV